MIAYLVQTAASGMAILILAGLAWRFGVGRHPKAMSEDTARALFADEFPDMAIGQIWLAADARSALARSGEAALIVYAVGDGHVVRSAPWASLTGAKSKGQRMFLSLNDRSAPRAIFRLGDGAAWPPALDFPAPGV